MKVAHTHLTLFAHASVPSDVIILLAVRRNVVIERIRYEGCWLIYFLCLILNGTMGHGRTDFPLRGIKRNHTSVRDTWKEKVIDPQRVTNLRTER